MGWLDVLKGRGRGSIPEILRPETAAALAVEEPEPAPAWLLVPLGNPGEDYAATRHNLGRLLLQRWMDARGLKPGPLHVFPSGTLYALQPPFVALVPATWMNLSGQVCRQAVEAGFAPERMVILYDDKDLPLGLGRFRLQGGDGGHNGVRSVLEALGTAEVARLRLGIGPYERPLVDYVLGEWTAEEWERIDLLDAPFARFLDALAACKDLEELPGKVNAASFWDE